MGVAASLISGPPPAAAQADDPTRDRPCTAWFEPTYDRLNVIFPDKATRYFGVAYAIPPGGYIEVTGKFPHARYFSLQTATNTTQTIASLPDYQMVPDAGSSNPFLPGARRDVRKRRFTLRIVRGAAPPPEQRAPNTLYDSTERGVPGNILAYRLYLADRRTGTFGGVPLPDLTLVSANGTRVAIPNCPDLAPDTTTVSDDLAAAPATPDPVGRASDPPAWHRLVSVPINVAYDVTNTPPAPPGAGGPATDAAEALGLDALGASADNAYLYAYLSQKFGRVVLIRGRMPTTPKTFDGQKTMGSGQLRYWSMCSADAVPPQPTFECTHDEQVPVNRKGEFVVAVSSAADRPRRATTECGIGWLAWGPGARTFVGMRNQLPALDFAQSVQASALGDEEKTMGAYFPRSQYYGSAEEFDATVKCKRPAAPAPRKCKRSVKAREPTARKFPDRIAYAEGPGSPVTAHRAPLRKRSTSSKWRRREIEPTSATASSSSTLLGERSVRERRGRRC